MTLLLDENDNPIHPRVYLPRPPVTKDELWETVRVLWGVEIPRVKVCPDHVAPFDAFAEGFFGNQNSYSLWYGSRGCLAADTLITVNRAGLGRKRPISAFVHRLHGTHKQLGKHYGAGKSYDPSIPTYVQRADGDVARLGLLGNAWDSGIKQTYELVTDSGRRIRATAEHPFLLASGDYVPLEDLVIGDEVRVNAGRSTAGRQIKQQYERSKAQFHPHASRGQYWTHRLVAEAHLNRIGFEEYMTRVNNRALVESVQVLPRSVHVHHRNHDHRDNRLDNLELVDPSEHHREHAYAGKMNHVLEQIGSERVTSISKWHELEPTYDLTLADDPHNYIANGFVVHNTGKSLMLALLALTKAAILEINVTLLGGSMAQAQNVQEHIENLLLYPASPSWAVEQQIQTQITFTGGNWIRPLPASQKTVRGPHPALTCLDEIDEMDIKVYNAAMGQAMAKPNARGIVIPEMVVASSTWQNPVGTFQQVRDDALKKGLPVRTWCFKEVLKTPENPTGWMDPAFIERKRASVPAELFRVEYELGEPAGGSRAFDLEALNRTFIDMKPVSERHAGSDDEWVFEEPDPNGWYAMGADWAKEDDKTVIVVFRIDYAVRRCVYVRRVNRRPWPEMVKMFNDAMKKYQAVAAHDATGIGNVVNDLIDERAMKFVMSGRKRSEMLVDYISAVEQNLYQLPANTPCYGAHRATTIEEVYAPGKWNSHLADDVAAFALCHYAAEHGAPVAAAEGVRKTDFRPRVTRELEPELEPVMTAVGEVRVVDNWNPFLV
jgi:hypothetical protein